MATSTELRTRRAVWPGRFKVTPGGALTTLHIFGSVANDSANVNAGMLQMLNGTFYGTASSRWHQLHTDGTCRNGLQNDSGRHRNHGL